MRSYKGDIESRVKGVISKKRTKSYSKFANYIFSITTKKITMASGKAKLMGGRPITAEIAVVSKNYVIKHLKVLGNGFVTETQYCND